MKSFLIGTMSALAVLQSAVGAESELALEEIVVTAQRREQNLQDVPTSVTAFTGDDIAKANIRAAVDYLAQTPNVSFTEDGEAGKRGLGLSIRGVSNLVTGENAVVNSIGIYIDEFSVASVPSQVANPFLPDMERLEVLRGPQGTYFGRNSVGGAINLTTRSPTDEFEGSISVGGESYAGGGEQFSATGVLNLPVTENFKLRGVAYYEDSSGFVTNICSSGASAAQCPVAFANAFSPDGAKDSGNEYFLGRIKALWDVTDRTAVTMTLIYGDEKQGHDENVPSGILDLDTVDTVGIEAAIDPGTGFWPANRDKLSHDGDERNLLESAVAILNIRHQLSDDMTLKFVSGVIDADLERFADADFIGGMDHYARSKLWDGRSWSTELRVESLGKSLDWVAGVLYADDEQNQLNSLPVRPGAELGHAINGLVPTAPFPAGLDVAANIKNFNARSLAAFSDFTFHVTERLNLILGGRYTHDRVSNYLVAQGIDPTCCFPGSPGFPGAPGFDFFNSFVNFPRPPVRARDSFDDFSPRAGIRYEFDDDVSAYATIAKGYKAGGSSLGNDTNQAGDPAFSIPFDPEETLSYEAGIKSELFERRLRLNAAIFYTQWKDLQFESFRFLTPGDAASLFERTINIDEAEASGVELEFVALATDRLTFSGGFGYLQTEITSDTTVQITGGFQVNLQGLDIPKSPELTSNLAAEYRVPVGDNEAWARLEWIYREGQYSDIEGLTNRQTRGPSPNQGLTRRMGFGEFPYLSPDYDVLNLRAGFARRNLSFTAYVQNLTDEDYYTGTQENFGNSGIRLRPHPRIIGLSASYNFGR